MSLNTDNYNFLKASEPQGVNDYSPYVDKKFQNIQDINSGVYINNGLSLVNFDLSSIYNSSVFSDSADSFLAIPIITAAVHTRNDTGATLAPPTAGAGLVSLKSNYQHLVHQVELSGNGKTLMPIQPFISAFNHFKLLSQVSATDLKTASTTWGMSEILDPCNSIQWLTRAATLANGNANTGPQCGVGLCNNQPYNGTSAALGFQTAMGVNQNAGCVNEALQRRISRIVDIQNNKFNNLYGAPTANAQPTILNAAQLSTEFRPFYTTSNNYMYWYDIAIIPMKLLCDVMDKIGLTKKIDLKLRLYLNTGTIQVPVTVGSAGATADNSQYGVPVNTTFNATCPFTVNLLPATAANGGLNYAAGASTITAGCFVAKVPSNNISVTGGSVNLSTNSSAHPMPACRFYYSQITLSPAFAEQYILENRNKLVIYENVYFNTFNAIGSGSTFSGLVQSGIRNPIGLLIIPLISSSCGVVTTAGAAQLGFSQYASPYDTCPASSSPCSLTNLSVTLGNKNVLSGNNLFYTFENFMEQVSLAQTIVNEVSMNVGAIDQKWWEYNRYYYVDLARSKEADKATDRNLTMSFTNNSSVPIDVITFIIYLDKVVIDVETGIVKKE